MSPRVAVHAPDAPSAIGPFVHGVTSNGLLFCSGQVAAGADGAFVGVTIGDRVEQTLKNVEAICVAGGTTLANAVRCTVYLTDMATFPAVNDAYAAFFADAEPPARVTIGVASLPLGADVEIDAIVALPD